MAMAIRAAIDEVTPRLARDPGLDVAHHAREPWALRQRRQACSLRASAG
jgi:hypothetical protein